MSDFSTLKKTIRAIENTIDSQRKIDKRFYKTIEPILRNYFLENKKHSFNEIALKLNVSKGAVNQWLKIYLPQNRVEQLIKIYK